MPFSFSFTLTVPGLVNPFSAPSQLSASAAPQPKQALLDARSDILAHGDTAVSHRRPPSPSLLPPLSRKRGWVPSDSEPSHAAAIPTSTNGYLDTPAKYRDMMANTNEDEIEEMVAGKLLIRSHTSAYVRTSRISRRLSPPRPSIAVSTCWHAGVLYEILPAYTPTQCSAHVYPIRHRLKCLPSKSNIAPCHRNLHSMFK